MPALTLDIGDSGVARLVFNDSERSVNVLTSSVMARLDALITELEEAARMQRVRAVVVSSGKPGTFIAGADVDEIAGMRTTAEAEAGAREGQRIFRRLERLPVPVIAAINGTCLGGGTELALACSYRLASAAKGTRIGLPEVRLGIIPGFGGTVRLPRLIGIQQALGIILTGRAVSAGKAGRIGLVDEVVPAPILSRRAQDIARELADRSGHDGRRRRSGVLERIMEGTALGRRLILRIAERRTRRETKGRYPAPLAAIDVVRRTTGRPLDAALDIEAETVGRLAVSDVCRNLIHVFQLMQAAKSALPAAERVDPVQRAGIIGAGVMGGGIAQLLAYRDIRVRLKDIRSEAVGEALNHARSLFDKLVRKRRIERREADAGMGRIEPGLGYEGFGTTEVVIEAVVERLDVKKQVLSELELHVVESSVLASNTSALSISEMQRALKRPENFCGMHFFNPVHRMPLVEIVRGEKTSEKALAKVFRLTRQLDKTPVIVNDGPGFLVNRLLTPYLNEAGWMLAAGVSMKAVDQALVEFGMPMGPFRLLDEVGLDVARHAGRIMHEALGDRMRPAPPLEAIEATNRLGRKGGRGFYTYEDGGEREPDPDIYEELGDAVPATRIEMDEDEIVERTILAMVNEAARIIADGIVGKPGDVDLAMITGTGFPPFRGGLLRYADTLGPAAIVATLGRLAGERGPRFEPADLLIRLAESGAGFYEGVDRVRAAAD